MNIWIVEAKFIQPGRTETWFPLVYFPNISTVHRTRREARDAAKSMFNANKYNSAYNTSVRYRARKYIAEEDMLENTFDIIWDPDGKDWM